MHAWNIGIFGSLAGVKTSHGFNCDLKSHLIADFFRLKNQKRRKTCELSKRQTNQTIFKSSANRKSDLLDPADLSLFRTRQRDVHVSFHRKRKMLNKLFINFNGIRCCVLYHIATSWILLTKELNSWDFSFLFYFQTDGQSHKSNPCRSSYWKLLSHERLFIQLIEGKPCLTPIHPHIFRKRAHRFLNQVNNIP